MESPEDRLSRELEEGESAGGQRLSEQDVTRADRLDDGELAEEDLLPGEED